MKDVSNWNYIHYFLLKAPDGKDKTFMCVPMPTIKNFFSVRVTFDKVEFKKINSHNILCVI